MGIGLGPNTGGLEDRLKQECIRIVGGQGCCKSTAKSRGRGLLPVVYCLSLLISEQHSSLSVLRAERGRVLAVWGGSAERACVLSFCCSEVLPFLSLVAGLQSRPDGQSNSPSQTCRSGFAPRVAIISLIV